MNVLSSLDVLRKMLVEIDWIRHKGFTLITHATCPTKVTHISRQRVPRQISPKIDVFGMKSDPKAVYPIVMFLKLLVYVVELLSKVSVLSNQVAGLNWSDTIYPNVGYPVKTPQNRHFWNEKSSECILSINDVPETYVENSWSISQRVGINQPSGHVELKWRHITKLRVTPSKTTKINILA